VKYKGARYVSNIPSMLQAQGIDHITITVTNLQVSEPFYDKLMRCLGMRKVFSEYNYVGWRNSHFQFYISEAGAVYKTEKFVRNRVGLNHFSFQASSCQDVDTLFHHLKKEKIKIIISPMILRQYGNVLYYMAFEDPDGMKLEFGFPVRNESKKNNSKKEKQSQKKRLIVKK